MPVNYPQRVSAILRRLGVNNWSPDPDYNLGVTSLAEQAAIQEAEDELQGRRMTEDYGISTQRLGQSRERDTENLTANMVDRGLLHSGINVAEQGKLGQRYQERTGDLARGVARGREDIAYGRAGRERGYGVQMAQLARQRAIREEQRRLEEAERQARAEALRSLGM